MLKILLFLFKNYLDRTINKTNNVIIRVENKSDTTIFLTKSRNLFKFKSIKAIKKPNFLTFNTEKTFNLLI